MRAASLLAGGVLAALLLGGCAQVGSESDIVEPSATPALADPPEFPGIRVLENLDYGAGGPGVFLDVCLPEDDAPPLSLGLERARPAMLLVHGGSWRQGDKANPYWRSVCTWLASEGFVTFSANYRLAPSDPFPAAISDLRTAVSWMRDDAQVGRFDIDPERLGALGGSAGGNLVSLLGLEGSGELDSGTRVRAVVDLSGPIDLTPAGFALGEMLPDFRAIQLDYLGCVSYDACPQATDASPLYDIDETDPPFFVLHSVDEYIPIEQSDALVETLRDSGVDTTYVTVEGTLHSIAILDDDLRARIGEWLRARLG